MSKTDKRDGLKTNYYWVQSTEIPFQTDEYEL